MMIIAGFIDIIKYYFKVLIRSWAKDLYLKELGLYNRLQWEEGLRGG
jgi:hypothetical protein